MFAPRDAADPCPKHGLSARSDVGAGARRIGRPASIGLTTRQRQMLAAIETLIAERGFPPTLRELGLRIGSKSTNAVNDVLEQLVLKGYVTREIGTQRSIRVLRGAA